MKPGGQIEVGGRALDAHCSWAWVVGWLGRHAGAVEEEGPHVFRKACKEWFLRGLEEGMQNYVAIAFEMPIQTPIGI